MSGEPDAPRRVVTLEQVVEGVLTLALFAASALLVFGLAYGNEAALRAGIVILLFTPVARVVLVTAGLLRARDYVFGGLSAFVLAVLASSIWVAFRP
jgi:uncharacterized membrane protein